MLNGSRPAIRFRRLNRIESAPVEGMTAQYPPDSKIKATPYSMEINGVNGILGTGGSETAVRTQNGRNHQLIKPEQIN